MKKSFIVLLGLLFLLSCKEQKGYKEKKENDGDPVYSVENEDKAMNTAILEARRTYDKFLDAFKRADSTLSDFAVKLRFEYGDNSGEHMWLGDLHYKGEQLFGVLNSDPVEVNTVQIGDTIKIREDHLSDWMYVMNNKLVGGYTIRVLYDKMSSKEKQEFKKEVTFELE